MADPTAPLPSKASKHARRRRWIDYISFAGILVVLALSIGVLGHFLRHLDVAKVVETMGTIPWTSILAGIAFGAGGYAAMVGYDWSALQYIGARVPWRSMLLASFCGYAIGNTAGFTLVTGGAVRLRIYSRAGLDVSDIGRVTLFCMVAFGFGICAVSALSLLAHPHALADLVKIPAGTISTIGLAISILVVAFLFLCGRGREMRILRWQFKLPSAGLVLRQLVISAIDIGFACAALFIVLPHGAGLAFTDFLPVFCAALAFGIISHVPGGVGVFEATMLYALRHKLPAEQIVGGLLMFRIIYYILPMAQAIAILSVVEWWHHRERLRARLLSLPRIWPAAVAGLALVVLVFLMVTRDTMDFAKCRSPASAVERPPDRAHRPPRSLNPPAESDMADHPTGPDRETARILLDIGAVGIRPREPFVFTSGWASPVYIDCRRLISFPSQRRQVIDKACALILAATGATPPDAIAGGETAGIPYAAWLADRLDRPMLYVRKKAKGFGRNARIEGTFEAGARILLVEDLATDGASKLAFIEALRAAGGIATDAWVLFFYGIFPGVEDRLVASGVRLHYLATWWDVIDEAEASGRHDPADLREARTFLADPVGWSAEHGGRAAL